LTENRLQSHVAQGLTILTVKLSLDGEKLLVDAYDGKGSSCNFFAKNVGVSRNQTCTLIDILNIFMNCNRVSGNKSNSLTSWKFVTIAGKRVVTQ